MIFVDEAAFAAEFLLHLKELGWRTYPEILGVDIVGISPDEKLYAFETKMKFGDAVIAQCWKRLPYVHAAVAVVPYVDEYKKNYDYHESCVKVFGLGVWGFNGKRIRAHHDPHLRELQSTRIKDVLVAAAETGRAPGAKGGHSWSQWDCLQEKYLEQLKDGPKPIEVIIAQVEPDLRGKRCLVRKCHRESREHLITSGRWRKLELRAGVVHARVSA